MNTFDPVAYINEPRWHQSRLGLERIRELLGLLGYPQDSLRFVHVAGTNGKGSTSTYVASILQAAGYTTGLFTSPYIEHFCDRIKINSLDISLDALHEVTLQVKDAADSMSDHPTEFELMTAVAFLYFKQESCDIVVVEVGMGGRLDSTNVIKHPEVSVITALGLDHQDYLGDTIEEIAGEKAGIIKPYVPVVLWPQEPNAMSVLVEKADEVGAFLVLPNFSQVRPGPLELVEGKPCRTFDYGEYRGLKTCMAGLYQPYNAALAIEAVKVLKATGWSISDNALHEGIAQAFVPGRFEFLATDPLFVIDGAHNKEGIKALCASLEEIAPKEKFVFIVGVLEDKTYKSMIKSLLPLAKAFVTITPPNPRALSADQLASVVEQLAVKEGEGVAVVSAKSPNQAIDLAAAFAGRSTTICACGSLYSIASIKSAIKARSASSISSK